MFDEEDRCRGPVAFVHANQETFDRVGQRDLVIRFESESEFARLSRCETAGPDRRQTGNAAFESQQEMRRCQRFRLEDLEFDVELSSRIRTIGINARSREEIERIVLATAQHRIRVILRGDRLASLIAVHVRRICGLVVAPHGRIIGRLDFRRFGLRRQLDFQFWFRRRGRTVRRVEPGPAGPARVVRCNDGRMSVHDQGERRHRRDQRHKPDGSESDPERRLRFGRRLVSPRPWFAVFGRAMASAPRRRRPGPHLMVGTRLAGWNDGRDGSGLPNWPHRERFRASLAAQRLCRAPRRRERRRAHSEDISFASARRAPSR